MAKGSDMMQFNSPGGSTLQWGAGRSLLYLAPFANYTVCPEKSAPPV